METEESDEANSDFLQATVSLGELLHLHGYVQQPSSAA